MTLEVKKALWTHLGNIDSYHNKAKLKCDLLIRKNQSISEVLRKQTRLEQSNYELRLHAIIHTCRFLLKNSLPFHDHNESDNYLSR